MSAALVYGPYPPATGRAPAATLAAVRELLAEGVEVTVVSPIPSGAHHHADLRRLNGLLRLAKLLAGADRVILYVEPGLLGGSLPRKAVPPGRLAVGAALRRPRSVVVHCAPIGGSLHPPSVRWVFGSAQRVVAASPEDRDAFVAAGLPAERVEVAAAPEPVPARSSVASATPEGNGATASPPAADAWALSASAGRDEIQAEIRRRAAAHATATGGDGRPADHLPGTPVTRPLMAMRPLGPPPVRSPKPGVGLVKRLIRKATGWELDPIIEHVNRLQRATLEAFENQSKPR